MRTCRHVLGSERMSTMRHAASAANQPDVYKLLFENMTQGFALHEIIVDAGQKPVDYRFLSVNKAFEALTGLQGKNILGKTVTEVLPGIEQYWMDAYGAVALTGVPQRFKNYSADIHKYYDVWAFSPRHGQFATVISDITEQVELEEKLKYVYYHDAMTHLFNRQYLYDHVPQFESKDIQPLSIIMADINGLRIINESFGFAFGDETLKAVAKAIQTTCGSDATAIRWSGDDFMILMTHTDHDAAELLTQTLKQQLEIQLAGEISRVSVTIGQYTVTDDSVSIFHAIKNTEQTMRQKKMVNVNSIQNAPISMVLHALYEKNHREEAHSIRVSKLCAFVGTAMELDMDAISKLRIIGLVHDIGKIGIDDTILNKPDRLTPAEFEVMKKHSAIGFRILSAYQQTAEFAYYVLSHHEYFDGHGYPNGIKGDSIPLFTRILSVADSFDAMTRKRPYCAEKTIEEAIVELKRCAGTQFDPQVVDALIAYLQQYNVDEYAEVSLNL